MILLTLFWLSVLALFHSYVLYPILLKWMSRNIVIAKLPTQQKEDLPLTSILISAYNEESVIESKIESILNSDFPRDKIEILVGSDASTDRTNTILERMAEKNPCLRIFLFEARQGKGPVLNKMVPEARGDILILTDANVIFEGNTVIELVNSFTDPLAGLVDSNMKHSGIRSDGISSQENAYISREVQIKNREGLIWGAMMGPFGGCFAIRKKLFRPIPANFLVDDFYLNMEVLRQGFKAQSNLNSIVYEDVSNNLFTELRRKTRISTGNFQNLAIFSGMLWPPFNGIAFAFLSHKVLRWLGPFFLLIAFVTSLFLSEGALIYKIALWTQLILILLPLVDFLLRKINIHFLILRFLTHFYTMNLAMMAGFFKYMKGVKSNVWQPTQRNQSL
jgi:cellulose synthase/poly-beta-1,6-N-acetylglucosamine synthase-like glycosyltransferase